MPSQLALLLVLVSVPQSTANAVPCPPVSTNDASESIGQPY